jgi:hypothetical protein
MNITPEDYILKDNPPYSIGSMRWRLANELHVLLSDYIRHVDEYKSIKFDMDYYIKEWGLEKVNSQLNLHNVMRLSISHEFIDSWREVGDVTLEQLVKRKPKWLKSIDYSKFVQVKDEKYFADLKRAGDYRDALIEVEEEKFLELYKIGVRND